MIRALPPALLCLTLIGCAPEASPPPGNAATQPAVQPPGVTPPPTVADPTPEAAKQTIGLEGLNDLKIGQPVPAGSRWASRGAQASDACTTVSSPDYPGVYAIVERDAVQRITVGKGSQVTLVEGIGVGAPEQAVLAAFPGFRAEPHKYVEAPAKYLTTPGEGGGGPALRFEIGQDGKVGLIHVGLMPTLAYVEGCA